MSGPHLITQSSNLSATGKAFAVIEALASAAGPMSAVEIGAVTAFNRQTVHRVLAQLEELELVQRDIRPERYRLGGRFARLAIDGLSTMASHHAVRRELEALVEDVRETSNIGVLDGYDVVYVERVECDWPLRVQLKAGSRVPAYCTAIGKLLLAHMHQPALDAYLKAVPLKPLNENTIADPSKLVDHLGEIRATGYSINDQEDSIGLLAIAVPLFDPDENVIGGLALHGPEVRLPRERAVALVPQMQDVALKISRAFCETPRLIGHNLINGDA